MSENVDDCDNPHIAWLQHMPVDEYATFVTKEVPLVRTLDKKLRELWMRDRHKEKSYNDWYARAMGNSERLLEMVGPPGGLLDQCKALIDALDEAPVRTLGTGDTRHDVCLLYGKTYNKAVQAYWDGHNIVEALCEEFALPEEGNCDGAFLDQLKAACEYFCSYDIYGQWMIPVDYACNLYHNVIVVLAVELGIAPDPYG